MRHKKFIIVLLVLVVAAAGFSVRLFLLSAPYEGTWQSSGDLGGGYGWYLTYTFRNGSYVMEGYPPIYEEGRYRVISADKAAGAYNLRLSPRSRMAPNNEENPQPHDQELKISAQGELTIGTMIFSRSQ